MEPSLLVAFFDHIIMSNFFEYICDFKLLGGIILEQEDIMALERNSLNDDSLFASLMLFFIDSLLSLVEIPDHWPSSYSNLISDGIVNALAGEDLQKEIYTIILPNAEFTKRYNQLLTPEYGRRVCNESFLKLCRELSNQKPFDIMYRMYPQLTIGTDPYVSACCKTRNVFYLSSRRQNVATL